jgi:hypothetical protein
MDQATPLWNWWLALLRPLADVLTRPGWVRFVPWVTSLVRCGEEHTRTQLLPATGLESHWRVLEHCAASGAWERKAVERQTLWVLEQECPARWGSSSPVALEDTTGWRPSQKVCGTGTCHESSARSPTRAATVRAQTRVVMGDVVPGRPWSDLPHAARRYRRRTQWPMGETFRTQTALVVEWFRQAERESPAPLLAVCDGA